VAAKSVDLVVCTDVLEHVGDDGRALAELRRALRAGGRAVVHVPVLTSRTVEYGRAVAGDSDHVRAYGPDVADRFADAGLGVEWRLARRMPRRLRRRFGLFEDDVLFVLRAIG
jgi:SAM-dependent methyltransferase